MNKPIIWGLTGLMAGAAVATAQAETVKIGFVTTLTTPAAVIGNDMRDAVELALEHLEALACRAEMSGAFSSLRRQV